MELDMMRRTGFWTRSTHIIKNVNEFDSIVGYAGIAINGLWYIEHTGYTGGFGRIRTVFEV